MPTKEEYRQLERKLAKFTLRDILDFDSTKPGVIDYTHFFDSGLTTTGLDDFLDSNFDMSKEEFQQAYLARSGEKTISRTAVYVGLEVGFNGDGIDAEEFVTQLCKHVNERYGANLRKTASAYFDSEYNPINNYDMTETETPNITETTSGSSNSKVESKSNASSSLYGFNSADAVPATKSDADTTTEALKANNYTDGSRTTTGTRTLTRSGNIGVTTSQQMLESELELRKFDLLERVFQCFDKVFVRSVYAR